MRELERAERVEDRGEMMNIIMMLIGSASNMFDRSRDNHEDNPSSYSNNVSNGTTNK